MNDMREQLVRLALNPVRGEVWYVDDGKITLDDKGRKSKGNRPVVIAHCEDDYDKSNGVPIIPLSNSGEMSIDCIPIGDDYQIVNSGFKPTANSMAIATHPQIIPLEYFKSHCGLLGSSVMYAILYSLCGKYIEFDLT